MQVEVSLKVSAEEFYQLLISSLQEEVEMVTHKKYTEDQLSGLRYKKEKPCPRSDSKDSCRKIDFE